MIATRESRLALWQAEHVKRLLQERGHTVSLLGMTTRGDQILDRSLSKVGGKGLFVKELETALEEGRADIAVHSLKDVPMELPEGFALACVLEREDPRDALVSPRYASLDELPQGAVVGTSSLRRVVLLRRAAARPAHRAAARQPRHAPAQARRRPVRRHRAGGRRPQAARPGGRIRSAFEPEDMLPAAGQGALGIEVRADAADLIDAAGAAGAPAQTGLATAAERAVSRAMGGSCSMPLAAHARWQADGGLAHRRGLGRPGRSATLAWAVARPRRWRRSPTARRPRRSARAWRQALREAGAR